MGEKREKRDLGMGVLQKVDTASKLIDDGVLQKLVVDPLNPQRIFDICYFFT